MTTTSSPFLIFNMTRTSDNFRRQGNDLHELLATELARHRAEDTGTDWLLFIVKKHSRVFVEANDRAIRPTHPLLGTNDNRIHDITFLHARTRNGILHGNLDDIANS